MLHLYKILTAILAFTGCISLIISGEVNPLMSLTGMGLLPGYHRFLKGMPQANNRTISGFSFLTLLIFFFDSLIISNDYFLGVAHLTITFQAIKSFDLKEPWDHLQVYFMSLLQLIIASELTHSIAFGVIFIVFLLALVTAIVLAHFIKEGTTLNVNPVRNIFSNGVNPRKPVIYISLLTLLITIIFFVSTPRISPGRLWGRNPSKAIKTASFSAKVDFGSFGDVKLDPTVVMRVELMDKVASPYYWRGLSLNYFDGISWMDTLMEKAWIYKRDGRFNIKPFKDATAIIQKVFVEPMDTDVVFGLSEIAAVDAEGTILFMDKAGALFLPAKKGRSFSYTVYSISAMPLINPVRKLGGGFLSNGVKGDISDYLQLPEGIERVSILAKNVTEGIDKSRTFEKVRDKDIDKAIKIEDYLRRNYTYSLSTSQPARGINPIEDFLFNSKKGYCEHYATAMVLMLRAVGIPSRIVTGFAGGEVNEYGGYIIVRQSNAHSWVEAVIDGRWIRFDPTPSVLVEHPSILFLYLDMLRMKWNRYVVAFSSSDQKEIVKVFSMPFRLPVIPDFRLQGFRGILYVLLSLGGIILIIFFLKCLRFRRYKYSFVTSQYIKLRNEIKNKGARITLSSTPSEVRSEAVRLGIGGKVVEFIRLYEEHRFGGKEMSRKEKVWYQGLITEIKKI